MKRPSLALAMIVKNEAENLPRLFKSFEGCFDEVHITDTGSSDNTVDLAKQLGAQVHHFDWVNDFSAARNASFDPVKTDYIMWLDGDDVLENKDAFIQFRDNIMNVADYWVATYHYSSNAQGKPTCSFARERVLNNKKGFRWKYFVHEGIIPQSPYGPVRAQYTPAWAVKHMRTDEDLKKDRSRNLSMFESHKNQLDPRMTFYYGKELFEAQKHMDAAPLLVKAAADPSIEMHDRILAIQYACYSYLLGNQYGRAIELAYAGLQLNPHRAEFYCIIGDAYLKLGNIGNAIPSFEAAKNCIKTNDTNTPNPLFANEDSYTSYPTNQLARIWANIGDMPRARRQASLAIHKYKSDEGKQLLGAIQEHKAKLFGFKTAKPCEDIVISCPGPAPYLWDPEVYKKKAMGGSETAAIEMAYWLHKLSGRPVKVFNERDKALTYDGVEYISKNEAPQYFAEHKPWMHIAWRHNMKVTDAPTFVWCHDLVTPGGENHANYNKMLCLTPFHKNFVMGMQNVPSDKIFVTRNGLDPKKFEGGPWEKDPMKFVFSSSPDRGLDRAMLVLDRVREKYPDIKMHIFYGIEHLGKYGLGALQEKLKAMFEERKDWVTYHGQTEQNKLMAEFKSAAYAVQPSDFIETSMISAMERSCCGIYQIMRRIGGCADTLAKAEELGMATLVDSDCITEAEHDLYANEVIKAMDEDRYKRVKMDATEISWEKVAQSWLNELPKLF